jgi:hypothetical protein
MALMPTGVSISYGAGGGLGGHGGIQFGAKLRLKLTHLGVDICLPLLVARHVFAIAFQEVANGLDARCDEQVGLFSSISLQESPTRKKRPRACKAGRRSRRLILFLTGQSI